VRYGLTEGVKGVAMRESDLNVRGRWIGLSVFHVDVDNYILVPSIKINCERCWCRRLNFRPSFGITAKSEVWVSNAIA
jgi:hypothetical protein